LLHTYPVFWSMLRTKWWTGLVFLTLSCSQSSCDSVILLMSSKVSLWVPVRALTPGSMGHTSSCCFCCYTWTLWLLWENITVLVTPEFVWNISDVSVNSPVRKSIEFIGCDPLSENVQNHWCKLQSEKD
jgi:hypothetical protein